MASILTVIGGNGKKLGETLKVLDYRVYSLIEPLITFHRVSGIFSIVRLLISRSSVRSRDGPSIYSIGYGNFLSGNLAAL